MKQQFLLSRISWSSSGTRVIHDTSQAADGDDPIFLEIRGKEGKVPQSAEVTTATGLVSGQQKTGVGRERAQDGRAEAAVEGSALLWWEVQGTQGTPTRQSLAQLAPFPGARLGGGSDILSPHTAGSNLRAILWASTQRRSGAAVQSPCLGLQPCGDGLFVSFGSSVLASDSMCGPLPVLVLDWPAHSESI